jgi:hypothetical protein
VPIFGFASSTSFDNKPKKELNGHRTRTLLFNVDLRKSIDSEKPQITWFPSLFTFFRRCRRSWVSRFENYANLTKTKGEISGSKARFDLKCSIFVGIRVERKTKMDAEGRKKGKDTPTDDKEEGLLENVGAGLGMGAASVALRQRQKDDEVERERGRVGSWAFNWKSSAKETSSFELNQRTGEEPEE